MNDLDQLKILLSKVAVGQADTEEKLRALKAINALLEDYQKALTEALAAHPE